MFGKHRCHGNKSSNSSNVLLPQEKRGERKIKTFCFYNMKYSIDLNIKWCYVLLHTNYCINYLQVYHCFYSTAHKSKGVCVHLCGVFFFFWLFFFCRCVHVRDLTNMADKVCFLNSSKNNFPLCLLSNRPTWNHLEP